MGGIRCWIYRRFRLYVSREAGSGCSESASLSFICAAPGFRDYGRGGAEGAARYVGSYGYSWSSATNGIYGQYLVFSVTSLSSSNALNRAFGFQLRCLSE